MDSLALSRTQQTALVLLRTLIGWHFLYEGLVKLVWPAWTRAGVPMGRFSSAGYLRSSTGPSRTSSAPSPTRRGCPGSTC